MTAVPSWLQPSVIPTLGKARAVRPMGDETQDAASPETPAPKAEMKAAAARIRDDQVRKSAERLREPVRRSTPEKVEHANDGETFQIEQGVPVPSKHPHIEKLRRTIQILKVGDSFAVWAVKGTLLGQLEHCKVKGTLRLIEKAPTGYKHRYRVWRTE